MHDYPWVEEIQVRWKDVDAFHHVNHAVSISYLEIARANFWRARMGGLGPMDIPFVIAHLNIDYKRPIHLYDRVRVGMGMGSLKRTSFSFVYEIEAEGRMAVEAETVQVCINHESGRAVRVPEQLALKLVEELGGMKEV